MNTGEIRSPLRVNKLFKKKKKVRYDRSAATLPPEIADDGTVLLDPRTPLT